MTPIGVSEEVGQTLDGRYQLSQLLGSSPASRVYLALDTNLSRLVVVRILNSDLTTDHQALQDFNARMHRESRASDDFIVKLLSGRTPTDTEVGLEAPYLVYQFLSGGSLRAMLDANGPLSVAQTVAIGLAVSRGLRIAHEKGAVHYDIRPSNILFDDNQVAHIKDFGLAKALAESSLTEPFGMGSNSVLYGAPELVTGADVDGKCDVYSLALVLAECVTGSVPLSGSTTAETLRIRADQDLELPAEMGPLRRLLESAGRVDPSQRPDAATLSHALSDISNDLTDDGPLPTVPTLDIGSETMEMERPVIATTVRSSKRSDGAELRDRPDPAVGNTDHAQSSTDSTSVVEDSADVDEPAVSKVHRFAEPASDPEPGFATVVDPTIQESLLEASKPRSFGPVEPFGRESGGNEGTELAAPPEPSGRPRRNKRRRVLVGVLLVVALAAGGYAFWWFQIRIPQHLVPTTQGQDVTVATKALKRLNFVVDTSQSDRRDGTKPGQVLSQSPAPGTSLSEGETVKLNVSLGPTLRTLPSLTGLSREDALNTLMASDLVLGTETPQADESVPAGTVISSGVSPDSPAVDANGQVPRDTAVDLVVSSGPAPRVVPSGLIGASVDQARAALEEVQLVANVLEAYDEKAPKGQIVSSSAASGEELPRGSKVTLTMSIGPAPITVPDVRGQSGSAGASALEKAGFEVEGIEGSPSGVILQTDPTPGEKRQRGTAVRIFTKSR
ncbi:MAG: PASTA domain-containing protein [Microthrixaceae bacterium]|nr:PASTA domain-containing protein [Microthrixaceae bacterium]